MRSKGLAGVLIHDRQDLDLPTVFGAVEEEVVGPYVVLEFCTMANTRVC